MGSFYDNSFHLCTLADNDYYKRESAKVASNEKDMLEITPHLSQGSLECIFSNAFNDDNKPQTINIVIRSHPPKKASGELPK
ncbi:MAG TPA: hypothetical protein VFD52_01690 [Clostridia bacterium]|nr:hypothetical protein [Clostridia bacterium]